MHSRYDEYEWLQGILLELYHKYDNHNKNVIGEILDIIKYRKEKEVVTMVERYRQRGE